MPEVDPQISAKLKSLLADAVKVKLRDLEFRVWL
jgi:hypothetical protein